MQPKVAAQCMDRTAGSVVPVPVLGIGEGGDTEIRQGRRTGAQQGRRKIDDQFIHKARGKEGAQDAGAAFHHDVPDAFGEEQLQSFGRVAGRQMDELPVSPPHGGVRRNLP
ncbi:hypothetical protein AHiyo8_10340 [Arthrobacter sp. Hiyo8]|nr:hypothetical protein AHiyo8_10340 [Arthrobacter sp. Hiyo8]